MIAIDTNILIYALGTDEKTPFARSLILRAALIECVIPLQVHAEFANVCRRKTALSAEDVRVRLKEFGEIFVAAPTRPEHIDSAVDLSFGHRLAYFDALICVVVRSAGAMVLFSEDMQDGFRWNGLQIVDPFNLANKERVDRFLEGS